MVAANIRVFGLRSGGFRGGPFKNLEVGPVSATKVSVFFDDRAGMDIELVGHPVVLALEGSKSVDALTADDVDKAPLRLVEVWHRETDVIGAPHSG